VIKKKKSKVGAVQGQKEKKHNCTVRRELKMSKGKKNRIEGERNITKNNAAKKRSAGPEKTGCGIEKDAHWGLKETQKSMSAEEAKLTKRQASY